MRCLPNPDPAKAQKIKGIINGYKVTVKNYRCARVGPKKYSIWYRNTVDGCCVKSIVTPNGEIKGVFCFKYSSEETAALSSAVGQRDLRGVTGNVLAYIITFSRERSLSALYDLTQHILSAEIKAPTPSDLT